MSGKKSKNQKKQWIIGFCVLLIIAATGGMIVAKMTAKPSDIEKTTKDTAGQDFKEDDSLTDTITWKGEKYKYNDHLSNFLFLGIDEREKVETNVGHADAGQSDALYLLSWDRQENTTITISIPRDTITEVETYGPGGESLGTSQDHISLAYAYGDGSYKSGELAKEAVSKLFYGVDIQGYCAINLDALPVLSDSVGGVKVTVPNDSLEEKYPEFKYGSQVTLDGTNTEAFVRYRDINIHHSAITRMERQQVFIKAFEEAAKKRSVEDSTYAVKLYTDLEPYMVTNISKDQLLKITKSMTDGTADESWTVPGDAVEGNDGHDEYHVDDNALYEKIIETFYKKVSDSN
jgi:LCP family protein required for cell wall assembly